MILLAANFASPRAGRSVKLAPMNIVLRALRIFRPDGPRIALVLVLLIAGICLNLIKPWPLAKIIDTALLPQTPAANNGNNIPMLCALLLAIQFFHGLLNATQTYLAIAIGLRGLTRVRNEVFATLHDEAPVGDDTCPSEQTTFSNS